MGDDNSQAWAAATQLAGQAAQAYAQGRMNKKAIEYNNMVYDRQRKDALADWEMQNKYNSAEQQMVRLREAGLNPHLIYGSGSATNTASNVPTAQTPAFNPETPDYASLMAGPVDTYLQTRSQAAQLKLMDAQTLKVLADTNTANFTLEQKQLLAETQSALLKENLAGMRIKNTTDVNNLFRKGEEHNANMARLDADTKRIIQETKQSSETHEKNLLQQSKNMEKTIQEIINLRRDEVVKRLEAKVKNGEITRQAYEKETNSLDQMVKYAQLNALQGKDIGSPEDAMKYIDKIIGLGSFIK